MSSTRPNLAVRIAVPCVAWALSAGMTIVLLPFLILFWLWSALTDYSDTVKKKDKSSSKGSLVSRGLGASHFVQLKDVSIHYIEAGDRSRPLMLCLHGFPEFWFSWRHQLKEFSTTHRVVAVDLRGYGDSDKPNGRDAYKMDKLVDDVRQIIDILGNGKCDVLLAHDWGAGIGWELVIRHPELVRRFVPMNCPHPAAFIDIISTEYSQILKSWYMIFFQLPVVPEKLLTAFGASLFCWVFQRPGLEHKDAKAYLDLYQHPSDLTGPINYYRSMIDPDTMGQPGKRVKVPTLLIWGGEDRFLNISMAHRSAKWAENFTLGLIPEASHWVQQDAPRSVNEKIREFL
ncbi:epoxide hydrolase 4-like isoform X1 [Daphnia pulex]|uniref:epoxide hydrolase 4-like isoform X1 n=1 Tax=Daphnia pulex TaxID=6669 RepID=UPI001EE029FD|nr:epoxide hydrolase 4-like isoform X1 [Daphnia pulex]